MRFPPEFLNEIRARVPVSQVVGQRVKLKKEGREWRGLSPFNAERTPSFFVNDQKQFYHDFSSGRHGDVFDFLVEVENLTFPEAVEKLAAMAGLELPRRDAETQARDKKRATLAEALELAAALFVETLHEPVGARARGYLADRDLDPATQRLFRLGYAAPERFSLRDALAAKGVDAQLMIEAGLLVHGEGIAVPYDRFQNRVMFPIHDRGGRVIAFGGRALDPSAKAKYLNSPETELFHKGSLLFNHHRARKPAGDTGRVIAVEGYVDVIAMTKAGFAETVAPLGTALTADQCGLLWTLADQPILCFDGDAAGRKAAYRALETALPLIGPGKSLKFAALPDGQDPDDLARSGGAEAIAEVIDAAKPFAEMLFQRETEGQTFDTPEKRAALERRVHELAGAVGDEMLRKHYAADMTERVRALFGGAPARRAFTPRERPGRFPRRNFDPEPRVGFASAPLPPPGFSPKARRESPREIVILAALIGHPEFMERAFEEVAGLEFTSAALAHFHAELIDLAAEAHDGPEALAAALEARGAGEARSRILESAQRLPDWWALKPEAEASDAELVFRQCVALQRKTGTLHRELKSAQAALAADPTEQNFARLLDIKSSLADLASAEAAVDGFGELSGRKLPPV